MYTKKKAHVAYS